MIYDKNQAHYIVVTAILVNKERKYLIVKRADWEKMHPRKWTVPGGKLKVLDYALRDRDTPYHWYYVLEDGLKREIEEEVGLGIKNVGYVTSLVYIRLDKIPCLIISLWGEPVGEEIKLCSVLTEYKWVDIEEAKNYDLIEGIYNELRILNHQLKTGKIEEWGNKNL